MKKLILTARRRFPIWMGAMWFCCLGASFLAAGATTLGHDIIATYYFRAAKVRYELKISMADLERSPKWDPEKAPPPLSPDAAFRKVLRYLGESKELGSVPRERPSIMLKEAREGLWFYIVDFSVVRGEGSYTGLAETVQVGVLLNGEVIAPTVSSRQW